MTLLDSTRLALILSLLAARATTQVTLPPAALTSEYYCPLVSTFSTLTACASYASSFDSSCAPLFAATQTAEYLSCYCDSGLLSLETLCYNELATCAGLSDTLPYTVNGVCTDSSAGLSSGSGGSGTAIITSASTTETFNGPAATESSAESSGSAAASSSGSSITSSPETRTSATQSQASSTSSTSTQSSASGTRPVMGALCVSVGLMIVAALV